MTFPIQIAPGVPSSLQSVQQPIQHAFNTFWQSDQVREHLRNLQESMFLLKSVQRELEEIYSIKRSGYIAEGEGAAINHLQGQNLPSSPIYSFNEIIKLKKVFPEVQESVALEAASSLVATLKSALANFNAITSQTNYWEEKSMAVRLGQKQQKYKRNKLRKKRKIMQVAELVKKEREGYDKADQDADEWRTREIAKDIAMHKMESMKKIAKLKAIEERKKLESELELVLVVEKLQVLRSIRIHKLKKQGHFFPEEDDKYIEQVRAAVEEEERQAAASVDDDASKDAITTLEEARKPIHITNPEASDANQNRVESPLKQGRVNDPGSEINSIVDSTHLPFEFYHYYHGSSNDMGTLIEVRRIWDAYCRPGGSRIPGHWVQPPPPADEVWASYLVGSKTI